MARKHGFFRPHVAGLSGIYSTTLREGGGGIITSIFGDGTDGFYFDFSKTDRLFQNLTGTPADGAGENIYLGLESSKWSGRTLEGELAAQSEKVSNGTFDSVTTGWTASSATLSIVSGKLHLNTSASDGRAYQAITTVVGRWYRASVSAVGLTGAALLRVGTAENGTQNGAVQAAAAGASGSATLDFVATATTTYLTLRSVTVTGDTVEFDSISVKEISGNHGLQATTAAQPKWQTGGLARFDGTDDNLLTTLVPGTAMSLLFKGTPGSLVGSRLIMGSNGVSGTSRIFIALDASGNFCGGVGADSLGTIKGNTNRNNTTFVGALTADGTTVRLFENGSVVYEAPQNGAINTTHAIAIGAQNAAGVIGTFYPGDTFHALAIKKALTAAQITAITNLWGTS